MGAAARGLPRLNTHATGNAVTAQHTAAAPRLLLLFEGTHTELRWQGSGPWRVEGRQARWASRQAEGAGALTGDEGGPHVRPGRGGALVQPHKEAFLGKRLQGARVVSAVHSSGVNRGQEADVSSAVGLAQRLCCHNLHDASE